MLKPLLLFFTDNSHIKINFSLRWRCGKLSKSVIEAFTLAEVLLALSTIGILAALTIPSLIQQIEFKQNKVAFKKAYSDIAAATQRIMNDNGGSLKGVFANENGLRDKYLNYLIYTKKCDSTVSYGNCWHAVGKFYWLNGAETGWTGEPGAILNNGALLNFSFSDTNCANTSYYGAANCGFIAIDVNGFKAPNTFGKDIFELYIQDFRIRPDGIPKDATPGFGTCINGDQDTNNYGLSCAVKVLENENY